MFLRRAFNTFSVLNDKNSSREARFLMKMLKKNSMRKPTGLYETKEFVMKIEDNLKGNKRRLAVLNKLFMKYITDLMATGNVSADFIGRGVEVSRVAVTPNYDTINVFWLPKNQKVDPEIDKLLSTAAHSLHHELTQLRLMGKVPKIIFVKDIYQLKLTEVEDLLKNADLGSEDDETVEFVDKSDLERMPMNVYGLDHDKIAKKIQEEMQRRKATHRRRDASTASPLNPPDQPHPQQISVNRAHLLSYIKNKNRT